MDDITGTPNQPSDGTRQQKAAVLKAQMEAAQPDTTQAPEQPVAEQAVQETGTGPVGQGDYIVREGDCISSIAKDTGHFWETIWNDPTNAELKTARTNPNVLLAGDRVTIPTLEKKQEPGATEQRHRFQRKGEPSELALRFCVANKPRANAPYQVEIDGQPAADGFLDPDGKMSTFLPGNARVARIIVGEGDETEEYEFALGHIPPVSEPEGVRKRLENLGFTASGSEASNWSDVQESLRAFQRSRELPDTGRMDAETQEALLGAHGS